MYLCMWAYIYVCVCVCVYFLCCFMQCLWLQIESSFKHSSLPRTENALENVNPLRSDSFIIQNKRDKYLHFSHSFNFRGMQVMPNYSIENFPHTLEQTMTLENQFLITYATSILLILFFFYLIEPLSERKAEAILVRGQTHGRMRQNVESVMRWKQKNLARCFWTNTWDLKWKLFKSFRVNSDRNVPKRPSLYATHIRISPTASSVSSILDFSFPTLTFRLYSFPVPHHADATARIHRTF